MPAASSGVEDRRGSEGGGAPAVDDAFCDLAADFIPIDFHFTVSGALRYSAAVPMNLVARQDRVLLGGLAVALIVVFARPIRFLLDLARDV